MLNSIPAPRTPFLDQRTGLVSREWYLFLLSLFELTGGGSSDLSIEDLAKSPSSTHFTNYNDDESVEPTRSSNIPYIHDASPTPTFNYSETVAPEPAKPSQWDNLSTKYSIVYLSDYNTPSGSSNFTFDGSRLLLGQSATWYGSTVAELTGSINGLAVKSQSGVTLPLWDNATTGDNKFVEFYTEGTATLRGSITYNRAGGLTAYNVTSDYRLKTIKHELNNVDEIDSMKVYIGRMNGASMDRPMFIAHELQQVAPYSVTGEKDGNDYQMINHSSLVPLLTAEIKSLRKRVITLEQRLSLL